MTEEEKIKLGDALLQLMLQMIEEVPLKYRRHTEHLCFYIPSELWNLVSFDQEKSTYRVLIDSLPDKFKGIDIYPHEINFYLILQTKKNDYPTFERIVRDLQCIVPFAKARKISNDIKFNPWKTVEMIAYREVDAENDIWAENCFLLESKEAARKFFTEDNPVLLDIYTDEEDMVLHDFKIYDDNSGKVITAITFYNETSGKVVIRNMSKGWVIK